MKKALVVSVLVFMLLVFSLQLPLLHAAGQKGSPVNLANPQPTSESDTVQAGWYVLCEVSYSTLLGRFINNVPDFKVMEQKIADDLWTECINNHDEPVYVKTEFRNMVYDQQRDYTEVRAETYTKLVFKVNGSYTPTSNSFNNRVSLMSVKVKVVFNPALIWIVVAIAATIIILFTTPIWGPIMLKAAGLDVNTWYVFFLIWAGLVLVGVFALPKIIDSLRGVERVKVKKGVLK